MSRVTPIVSVFIIVCLTYTARAEVADLITTLSQGNVAQRITAANALEKLGPMAKSAVPTLTTALKADNLKLRLAASMALARIGSDAHDAVSSLVSNLGDSDAMVRAHAAYALGKIKDSNKATVKALVDTAFDSDPTVRREVLVALHEIGPSSELTMPLWVKALKDNDPQVILPALHTLADRGKAALPSLRDALKDEDACYWACLVVAEIGPDAAELVPEVLGMLKHRHGECRMQALVTLGEIGPKAKSAVPAIVELLKTEELLSVRYAAAFALGQLDDSPVAEEALNTLYQSDDEGLRTIAAWSLLKLDPDHVDPKLEETMIAALGAKDNAIRQIALRALRESPASAEGPNPAVIQAFIKLLHNATPEIVDDVIAALAARGEASLPGIIQTLSDKKLRPLAVQVALRLGAKAKPATPALIKALKETKDDPILRREIQFTLGAIGPAAVDAVPELIESLAAEDSQVQNSACYALGKIGPAATEATAALARLMRSDSDNSFTPVACVWALLRIHPDNARIQQVAVPLLIKALDDERGQVRAEIAVTLGNIGPAAKDAIPHLKKAMQDGSPRVRQAVEQALRKLQTP